MDAVKFLVAGVKKLRPEPPEKPKVWPLKPVERSPRRRPPAQTSRRATPPTWGQIKRLMQMSEEGARGLGLGNNPAAIFLMCLVIISIQVSPVRGKAYWTYGPMPLLFQLVVWSHPSISNYTALKSPGVLVGSLQLLGMSCNPLDSDRIYCCTDDY